MARHRHRRRRTHLVRLLIAAALLGAGAWWGVTTLQGATAPTRPPFAAGVPTNVTTTPATAPDRPLRKPLTAEQVYLRELAEAGLDLTHEERLVALDIARQHIRHGHLIGMREWIRDDFRKRIPHLDEQQTEAAKVAVEHHFLRVTGRKQ